MKKLLLILSFVIIHCSLVQAQGWLWGRQGKGSKLSPFGSPVVATDNDGNAYMADDYGDTIVFGNDTLTKNWSGFYLVKYNASGSLQWAVQPSGNSGKSDAVPLAIAVAPDADIVLAGEFSDTLVLGNDTLVSDTGVYAFFLVTYNSAGNVLWARQSHLTNRDWFTNTRGELSIDKWGDIYAAGDFGDTISFGSDTLVNKISGTWNSFLVKYSSAGNVLWVRQAVAPDDIFGGGSAGVSVTANGDVYITGGFYDTISFGTDTLKNGPIYLVKYDSGGNVLWARHGVGSLYNFDQANSITTDNNGDAFITGKFDDTLVFNHDSVFCPTFDGEMFLTKYDTGGNVIWVRQTHKGYSGNDISSQICHDTENHIYILFVLDTSSTVFGGHTFSTYLNPAFPLNMVCIGKLDTSGNVLCGSAFQSYIYPRQINRIASDYSGDYIFTAGVLHTITMQFNVDVLSAGIDRWPYIARWQSCRVAQAPDSADSCADFTVPNVFTPNNDGVNDVFYVPALHADSYTINIYNRWGQLEFTSNSPNISWDGRNNAGVEVSDGVYYYIIKSSCGGNEHDKKGYLQLLR